MSAVPVVLCWQKNEKVESKVEYLLQNFDDKMEKKQVQTETPQRYLF